MGRKYTRIWKYILFYSACLYCTLNLYGCVQLRQVGEGNTPAERANRSIRSGDFKSALAENQNALYEPFERQMDLKIFQRGLIYCHPRNPERDFTKSRKHFKKLIDRYPESYLVAPAEMLLFSLERMEKMENEISRLEVKTDRLNHSLRKRENFIADYRNKLGLQKKQISTLNEQVKNLKDRIEKYKTIDLNTEKKKKD